MPSLTIKECEFNAMVDRIQADHRLSELLILTQAVIMSQCFPDAKIVTPHLKELTTKIQDVIITSWALLESERWPSRHIGAT